MFPHRDTVFHHLGCYLFHPSNSVWGMVARHHAAYFAKADERVGIQVRTFKWAPISTDEFYGQILNVQVGVSTFGYVSQGLAGLRPWVLMPPNHGKAPDTACRLAPTIETCFHKPPNYDCRAKARGDTGRMVQHIRHCEDFPEGVQLLES